MLNHKIIALHIHQINDTIPIGVSEQKTLLVTCNNLVLLWLDIQGVSHIVLEKLVKHATKHPGSRLKPFGGGLRLDKPEALLDILNFNYLTPKAKQEQAFRLLIESKDWKIMREFAIHNLTHPETGVLENDPSRELGEELCVALGIPVLHGQPTSPNLFDLIRDSLDIPYSETIIAHSPHFVSTLEPTILKDDKETGVEHKSKVNYLHKGQVVEPKLISQIITEANRPLEQLIATSLQNGRKKLSTLTLVPIDDFIRAYLEQTGPKKVKINGTTCSSNTSQLLELLNN
ncbi:MAG: hypothetical protein WCH76_04185 [Candidatus Riflemargulisbacteria bacterium]